MRIEAPNPLPWHQRYREHDPPHSQLLFDKVNLWLERSKSHPLTISLHTEDASAFLFHLLIENSTRWVEFRCHVKNWDNIQPLVRLTGTDVPNLRSFSIYTKPWWYHYGTTHHQLMFLQHAPVLRDFEWCDNEPFPHIGCSIPDVPLGQLERLSLRVGRSLDWGGIPLQPLHFLNLCTNLRSLTWGQGHAYYGQPLQCSPHPICLPVLEALVVDEGRFAPDFAIHLLDSLTLPKLEQFRLDGAMYKPESGQDSRFFDSLLNLLSRSGTRLSGLHLIPGERQGRFANPRLFDLLRVLNDLETLTLGPEIDISKVLGAMMDEDLCPSLRHLQLRLNYSDSDPSTFNQILECLDSRMSPPLGLLRGGRYIELVDIDTPFRNGNLNTLLLTLGDRVRVRFPVEQDPLCVGGRVEQYGEGFLECFRNPIDFSPVIRGGWEQGEDAERVQQMIQMCQSEGTERRKGLVTRFKRWIGKRVRN